MRNQKLIISVFLGLIVLLLILLIPRINTIQGEEIVPFKMSISGLVIILSYWLQIEWEKRRFKKLYKIDLNQLIRAEEEIIVYGICKQFKNKPRYGILLLTTERLMFVFNNMNTDITPLKNVENISLYTKFGINLGLRFSSNKKPKLLLVDFAADWKELISIQRNTVYKHYLQMNG